MMGDILFVIIFSEFDNRMFSLLNVNRNKICVNYMVVFC